MADKDTGAGAPAGKFVGTTLFWIVAAVLAIAIGVVYFVVDKNLTQTRDDLNKALKDSSEAQKKFTEEQVGIVTKKLTDSVATLEAANKKLSDEKDALAKSHSALADMMKTFTENEYKAFKARTEAVTGETASKLNVTTQGLQKVEVDVKYLKENVDKMQDKLKGLDSSIASLSTNSEALKKEQAALSTELKGVLSKSNVTEGELKLLADKTELFERKILAERASQAAKALKSGNTRGFLDSLDFKN